MSDETQVTADQVVKQARDEWNRFVGSRLSKQIIAAVGLVAVTGLTSVLPGAPVDRARQALVWTVSHDYDFAGRWAAANRWAAARGGWRSALPSVWPKQSAPAPAPAPAAPAAPVVETVDPSTETVLPVRGEVLYGYGWLPKGKEPHGGLDLAAAQGAPVVAIQDGTVLRVGNAPAVGGFVEVDHGFCVALYGQVSGAKVKAGDQVTKGQTLAAVAKPAGEEADRGPHLHLEVRAARGGKTVDPAPFLPLTAGGDGN